MIVYVIIVGRYSVLPRRYDKLSPDRHELITTNNELINN